MKKFGADLNGEIGGHIIINDDSFTWKPVRFLFFGSGVQDITIPINMILGYKIKPARLWLHIKGEEEMIGFYTFKGADIIEAIKAINPYIRMYE